MKKWLLIVLVLASVCGGAYWGWCHTGTQPLTEKGLTFAEVRQATIRDIVSATGQIEPREIVFVTSETPGIIKRLIGRVGDPVTEGMPLAYLDDRKIVLKQDEAKNAIELADAALAQAKASLAQAHANRDAAERFLKMQNEVAATVGIRTEREQAKSQLQAAEAGVKLAESGIKAASAKQQAAQTGLQEANLAHTLTSVRVPDLQAKREFLILERKVQEGQMVGPQSGPLFTLAGNLERVEVHAQVAEGDVNKIKTRLKGVFKITNYRDEDTEFEGIVKEIRPLASTIKGAVYYDAVIDVKNRKDASSNEWLLRPGMTTSVDIVRHEHQNAWRVPSERPEFHHGRSVSGYGHASSGCRSGRTSPRGAPCGSGTRTPSAPLPFSSAVGSKDGEEQGLKDSEGNEILEWEPGKTPTGPLRVIIGAPPARAPGFFDQPANVKI